MTTMTQDGSSVRRATYDRQACIRCGKPIYKGDPIESIQLEGASWKSWVHKGCTTQDAGDNMHVDDVVEQVSNKVLAVLRANGHQQPQQHNGEPVEGIDVE